MARDARGRFVKGSGASAGGVPTAIPAGGGVTFTLSGVEAILKRLRTLEPKVAKKVLRQALRKGAKRVQARVKQLAPSGPSGQVRRAIKVRAGKRSRKGTIRVNVQIGKGDFQGTTFYGAFTEYGTKRSGTGHKGQRRMNGQKGQHFMERAFQQEEGPTRNLIISEIQAGIEREAKG
jgi:HK97 gp10 family phage protein